MLSNLRVLHVLDHSLPHLSGYSVRSRYLMEAQCQHGVVPCAVTSSKHGTDRGVEEIAGISYFRTPRRTGPVAGLPIVGEVLLMLALARQIRAVIRERGIQIVHAHSPVLNGIPALLPARSAGVPVVYEIRAFWEDAAVDHGTESEGSLRYRATRFLETWLSRRVDAVGAISQGLLSELEQRGVPVNRTFEIPNGVDIEKFAPMPRDRELVERWQLSGSRVVGFIGSFYRYEGLDLLLQAWAKIAREVSDARLLLIGGGEAEDALRDSAKRLQIESQVIFAGMVPHGDIPRCYSVCDILVYPRKSMRLTELVTPLKPLEAMASGKAVVASDVGGLGELVKDRETGRLFPAGDSDAMAGLLKELLGDPDQCSALGAHGRLFVCKEREWGKIVRVHAETYARLLNGV